MNKYDDQRIFFDQSMNTNHNKLKAKQTQSKARQ